MADGSTSNCFFVGVDGSWIDQMFLIMFRWVSLLLLLTAFVAVWCIEMQMWDRFVLRCSVL